MYNGNLKMYHGNLEIIEKFNTIDKGFLDVHWMSDTVVGRSLDRKRTKSQNTSRQKNIYQLFVQNLAAIFKN